jgi:hypothetical protein
MVNNSASDAVPVILHTACAYNCLGMLVWAFRLLHGALPLSLPLLTSTTSTYLHGRACPDVHLHVPESLDVGDIADQDL